MTGLPAGAFGDEKSKKIGCGSVSYTVMFLWLWKCYCRRLSTLNFPFVKEQGPNHHKTKSCRSKPSENQTLSIQTIRKSNGDDPNHQIFFLEQWDHSQFFFGTSLSQIQRVVFQIFFQVFCSASCWLPGASSWLQPVRQRWWFSFTVCLQQFPPSALLGTIHIEETHLRIEKGEHDIFGAASVCDDLCR